MANHENRPIVKSVHLLLAFSRPKWGSPHRCIRSVIRDNEADNIKILEERLKIIGGKWRIHKTVNPRDVEKARKWLLKKLIDEPQFASCVDSVWRTALLQKHCVYGKKRFMLDIDTKNMDELFEITEMLNLKCNVLHTVETPNGWHYITEPFDTREILKLPYVSLQRDGYFYIKSVGF